MIKWAAVASLLGVAGTLDSVSKDPLGLVKHLPGLQWELAA